MSYCRWSSDNYRCDLYCYEGGVFYTHVAGNRILGDIPEIKWPDTRGTPTQEEAEAFVASHKAQHAFLENCGREDITLPHAGETFEDADLESFRARLVYLRELGYKFPDYVFDRIDEEIAELEAERENEEANYDKSDSGP